MNRPGMLLRGWVLLCGLSVVSGAVAANWTLIADPAVADVLAPWLPPDDASATEVDAVLSSVLATEGYFSPRIRIEPADDASRLLIDAGPRGVITSVNVTIDGMTDATQRDRLISDWKLGNEAPFRQADWDAAKQDVLARLLASEYADAKLVESRVEVDVDQQRVDLHARYDAGPRYRFGLLRVEGLHRHSTELVAHYNRRIDAGDPYSEAELIALQATLLGTPYFASAQVRLDRDAATHNADGSVTAPLLVTVIERPAHRLSFGAGVSSNTGARVETLYHTPDFWSNSWAMDSGLRIEQKRQSLFADVFLPPDERNRVPSLGVMVESSDIEGLRTEMLALGAQVVQTRGSIEQRLSLNGQLERRWHDGDSPVLSRALVPNVAWLWRSVDSLLFPRDGAVALVQIGAGSKAVLSDQDFVRLHGRWQQYLPVGQRDSVSLRAEVGYTRASSREHIPQDYLFRTGGTGSVRGYAYQSLGLQEGSATVGGRYLAVLSGEVTHWIDYDWGIAAFVDAGDAVDALDNVRLAKGYGMGGRWRTPAGPIGIDLAYGERNSDVHIHFSLAIPF